MPAEIFRSEAELKKISKVYHIPPAKSLDASVSAMRSVLEHRAYHLFRSFYTKQLVGIHLSCKQPEKNKNILFPFIRDAASILKEKDTWAFICDTSNRHKNICSNALEQIETTCRDSLENLRDLLPFFMLDGINGNYEYIRRGKGGKDDAYLAGELNNLDALVVFSVPYTHDLCGVSGALFSTGAGLASKRGKIKLYTQNKPRVNVAKCYACRRCLHECPVDAISMGNRHVVIDDDKCVDCGRCVEIARRCGISYNWNATPDHFIDMMLNHSAAAMNLIHDKVIFISIIPDAEKNDKAELLISRDPVALDSATLTLLKNNNLFNKTSLEMMRRQISGAESAGIGKSKYRMEDIAY